jgi:hypothetical protein
MNSYDIKAIGSGGEELSFVQPAEDIFEAVKLATYNRDVKRVTQIKLSNSREDG